MQMKRAIQIALLLTGLVGPVIGAGLGSAQPAPWRTKLPSVPADASTAYAEIYVETNAYGFVTRAEIKTATSPAFGQACLEAIRHWRYYPARENGFPVPAKFIQPIQIKDGLIDTSAPSPTSRHASAIRRVAPKLPDDLADITGEALVSVHLDPEGNILSLEVESSTHEELNAPCAAAVRQWVFRPAMADGRNVPAVVHIPFSFRGPKARAPTPEPDLTEADRPPRAIRQPSPATPPELAKLAGEAEISFVIDEHGFVLQPEVRSTDRPELAALAKAAVLNWKYEPAIKEGKSIAVRAIQPFRFNNGMVVTESSKTIDRLPSVQRSNQPDLPESLRDIRGYVNVLFSIDSSGTVTAVEATDASLAEFTEPTLAAARKWRFRPAMKAGEPTASKASIAFVFGQ